MWFQILVLEAENLFSVNPPIMKTKIGSNWASRWICWMCSFWSTCFESSMKENDKKISRAGKNQDCSLPSVPRGRVVNVKVQRWTASTATGCLFPKYACAWQNQQNDLYVQRRLRSAWASAQSDQSLRCPHEESLGPLLSIERTAKTLIRLGGCQGWSESSLGAHAILLVLSWGGTSEVITMPETILKYFRNATLSLLHIWYNRM